MFKHITSLPPMTVNKEKKGKRNNQGQCPQRTPFELKITLYIMSIALIHNCILCHSAQHVLIHSMMHSMMLALYTSIESQRSSHLKL